MKLLKNSCGVCETNCYILDFDGFEFIVDPGYDANEWVFENCRNPVAILLTHGHHDHIWDVKLIKNRYKDLKVYCPEQDTFMVETDCFNLGLNICDVDVKLDNHKDTKDFYINGVKVSYFHLPGHTPGCSIIEVENRFFTGDFVFKRCIGRSDLPYSNVEDMKESLIRFYNLKKDKDMIIHPGHGDDTTLYSEQKTMPIWIKMLS